MSSKFALPIPISHLPRSSLTKKSSTLSQTFWLPHSLATYRNTPQNTSAASSCTSQATTATRAEFRRAHKKTQKKHGLLLVPPERSDPGPRADRAMYVHREERRYVQGRRLLRLPWRPAHKIKLSRRVDLHAIDATPARWRALLDSVIKAASSPRNDLVKNYRVHPTYWLIYAQACPCRRCLLHWPTTTR